MPTREHYLEWPAAQNLAFKIYSALLPDSLVRIEEEIGRITIWGTLPLASEAYVTRATARCRFEVTAQWPTLIPLVWCYDSWVRRDPKWIWHASEDGQLCFEYAMRWVDEMQVVLGEVGLLTATDFAATWLLKSTRSLLNRHLFTSRHPLEVWPKVWQDWAHDRVAVNAQYRKYLLQQTFSKAGVSSHA